MVTKLDKSWRNGEAYSAEVASATKAGMAHWRIVF
jgi:hypothetical protein